MTHISSLHRACSSNISSWERSREERREQFRAESSSGGALLEFLPKSHDLALLYLFDNPLSWYSFSCELQESLEVKKGAYLAGFVYNHPLLMQSLLTAEQEESPLRTFALLVQRNGGIFEPAGSRLSACSLTNIESALKTERVVASFFVQQNGLMLQEFLAFQDDEGIVLSAMENTRHALRFASPRLQHDSRFSMMAFHMRDEAALHSEGGHSTESISLLQASERKELSLTENTTQEDLRVLRKLPQEGVSTPPFRPQA